jgi:TonB family protein
MTFVLESALRISVVLVISLVAAGLMRHRSAAVRHWILAVGLIAAAAMPALQVVAPRWPMPRPAIRALVSDTVPSVTPAGAPWAAATRAIQTIAVARPRVAVAGVAVSIWIAGVMAGLALLLAGFARLTWIASRCGPVLDRRWTIPARRIAAHFGVRREVVILQSVNERLLVTWGLRTPRIILPDGADEWSDERIRIVLCHEMSHVRRADWLLQMLGGLLRAIYWFNPLVWIACHWLRHESEHACDDDVLNLGMAGPDYATELLNIARTLRRPAWSPAPGMARPSSLQRRVRVMLNTTIDRSPLSGAARVVIAAAALSVALIAAGSGTAAQVVGSAFSGSFVDALHNAIPNVTVTLTNAQTGEKYTVRSGAEGRYTFDAIPDGDYRGVVTAVGFTETHPFFRIKDGRSTQPAEIPLPLASIEESVTVTSTATQQAVTPAATQAAAAARAQAFRQRDPDAAIIPPVKTRDVRPLYPPNRTDEEATVFLEGLIDSNGLMKGLQVLQPANADFARAAMDAVNGWQFEATRLHGVPVDTSIRVTVRFVR